MNPPGALFALSQSFFSPKNCQLTDHFSAVFFSPPPTPYTTTTTTDAATTNNVKTAVANQSPLPPPPSQQHQHQQTRRRRRRRVQPGGVWHAVRTGRDGAEGSDGRHTSRGASGRASRRQRGGETIQQHVHRRREAIEKKRRDSKKMLFSDLIKFIEEKD